MQTLTDDMSCSMSTRPLSPSLLLHLWQASPSLASLEKRSGEAVRLDGGDERYSGKAEAAVTLLERTAKETAGQTWGGVTMAMAVPRERRRSHEHGGVRQPRPRSSIETLPCHGRAVR
jgi:hypothetical protein